MAVLKDYPTPIRLCLIDHLLSFFALALTQGDRIRHPLLLFPEFLNLVHRVVPWCEYENDWDMRLALLVYVVQCLDDWLEEIKAECFLHVLLNHLHSLFWLENFVKEYLSELR